MEKIDWQIPMSEIAAYITRLEARVAELEDALYDAFSSLKADNIQELVDLDEERAAELENMLDRIIDRKGREERANMSREEYAEWYKAKAKTDD